MNISKIIQSYTKQYLNPILLTVGDSIVLGQEETDEKWKGWIWVELEDKTNSGWIPIQIIEFSADRQTGIVLKNYSAQELSVGVDDQIEIIEMLNGWIWCQNIKSKEIGWIPAECINSN